MKKIGFIFVLFTMVTMSTFAFSDGLSVSRGSVFGNTYDSKTLTQGTYNFVSYTLHIEAYGAGSYACAKITMDHGAVRLIYDYSTFNKTTGGGMHNGGSDIILEALAAVNHSISGFYSKASVNVRW